MDLKKHDIYLYGMITHTTALLLRGKFPHADTYCEVKEKHHFPGGETGGAATILASLGCKVKMDGNHTGCNTDSVLREFYNNIGVDVSRLYCDPNYNGTDEIIIIDKETRTTFGKFASYFEDYHQRKIKRWNTPVEEDIKGAKAAGIDPFFDEDSILAARYCRDNNIPFVTIDENFNHEVCKLASIIVVSSDWIRTFLPDFYSDDGKIKLIKKYTKNTSALVIFTGGGGTIVYGRNNKIMTMNAHKVDTVSTLGAGDTFKAGCIYGLTQGWEDEEIIKFSTACAAVACTKFPLPYNPPTLEETTQLIKSQKVLV
ncbi:MAG: carbohydrate kinase family protein [Chitinispirillia bacterium]|nr:carbohydrate kinase family protein [Chitinispirillia bacterium]